MEAGFALILTSLGLVVAVIVAYNLPFSVRHRSRARWTMNHMYVLNQPVLRSTPVFAARAGAQDRLFHAAFPIGSRHDTSHPELVRKPGSRSTATVSSVRRSLARSWPRARMQYTVYFREYDDIEVPFTATVPPARRASRFDFDASGIVVHQGVWPSLSALWSELKYSNGADLRLIFPSGAPTVDTHVELTRDDLGEDYEWVEELIIKHGVFQQFHF